MIKVHLLRITEMNQKVKKTCKTSRKLEGLTFIIEELFQALKIEKNHECCVYIKQLINIYVDIFIIIAGDVKCPPLKNCETCNCGESFNGSISKIPSSRELSEEVFS